MEYPIFLTIAPGAAAKKPTKPPQPQQKMQDGIAAPAAPQRPPLPESLWCIGIATIEEAKALQNKLAVDYVTGMGKCRDGNGYYVTAPSTARR